MRKEIESVEAIGIVENADVFSCPHCGAPLWRIAEGELELFRCKFGHAFSPENLTLEQRKVVAVALKFALRASFERSEVLRRIAERARSRFHPAASHLEEQYQEAQQHLLTLKRAIKFLVPDTMPELQSGESVLPTSLRA